MAKMSLIEWHEDVSSTDETLNEHTQEFINQTNQFISSQSSGKQLESLFIFLSFLNDYSKYHFIYQESIMELKSFPAQDDHKSEHKAYLLAISKIFKEVIAHKKIKYISDNDMNDGYRNIIEITYDFATDWFRSHISNLDKRFNDFLKFENS